MISLLKSCSYCGGIHQRGETCVNKPIKQKKISYVDKFRKTKLWQSKREEVCKRDNYLCQVCIRELHNTQTKYNFNNLQVHHIDPIVNNWNRRLDSTNLISVCPYHHKLAEDGRISKEELWAIVKEQEDKAKIIPPGS